MARAERVSYVGINQHGYSPRRRGAAEPARLPGPAHAVDGPLTEFGASMEVFTSVLVLSVKVAMGAETLVISTN